jgi:hypothetical protein
MFLQQRNESLKHKIALILVLGSSLIFQRTASFGHLKKDQNQRTGWFWVFKNIRIKKSTG